MARDLVAHGASVAAVQVAGRWASSKMPAYYARGELAARAGPSPGSTGTEAPLERVSGAAVVLESGPRKSTSHGGRTR